MRFARVLVDHERVGRQQLALAHETEELQGHRVGVRRVEIDDIERALRADRARARPAPERPSRRRRRRDALPPLRSRARSRAALRRRPRARRRATPPRSRSRPVPANRSSTRAPSRRCIRIEKSDSLTRPGVGRTFVTFGRAQLAAAERPAGDRAAPLRTPAARAARRSPGRSHASSPSHS